MHFFSNWENARENNEKVLQWWKHTLSGRNLKKKIKFLQKIFIEKKKKIFDWRKNRKSDQL
jgi:hypothetical protein